MPDDKKIPWYFKERSLVLAFLFVGPLALPLVWMNPEMSGKKKLLWTAALGILSYFLIILTMDSLKKIEEYYLQLKEMGL